MAWTQAVLTDLQRAMAVVHPDVTECLNKYLASAWLNLAVALASYLRYTVMPIAHQYPLLCELFVER